MSNKLKEETKPTMKVLQEARIKAVMITGDNSLTGINIGRKCCLIPRNQKILSGSLIKGDAEPEEIQWTEL